MKEKEGGGREEGEMVERREKEEEGRDGRGVKDREDQRPSLDLSSSSGS